jgi:hypothetical protein
MKCLGDFGTMGVKPSNKQQTKKAKKIPSLPLQRAAGTLPKLGTSKMKPGVPTTKKAKPSSLLTKPKTTSAFASSNRILPAPISKGGMSHIIKPTVTSKAKKIINDLTKPKTAVVQTSSPAVSILNNTSSAVSITSKASPVVVPGTTISSSAASTNSQSPKSGNTGAIVGGLAVAGIAAYMFMKE